MTIKFLSEVAEVSRKDAENVLESFIDSIIEELQYKGRCFIAGLGSIRVKYAPPTERVDLYHKTKFMDGEKVRGKIVLSKDVQKYLLSKRRDRTKAATE